MSSETCTQIWFRSVELRILGQRFSTKTWFRNSKLEISSSLNCTRIPEIFANIPKKNHTHSERHLTLSFPLLNPKQVPLQQTCTTVSSILPQVGIAYLNLVNWGLASAVETSLPVFIFKNNLCFHVAVRPLFYSVKKRSMQKLSAASEIKKRTKNCFTLTQFWFFFEKKRTKGNIFQNLFRENRHWNHLKVHEGWRGKASV